MDSEQEIRQREQQRKRAHESTNGTQPSAAKDGDGDGVRVGNSASNVADNDNSDGLLGALPLPSISRWQLLVVGAICLLALTIYLKAQDRGGEFEFPDDQDSDGDDVNERVEGDQVAVENRTTGERIELPVNPDNPLDMDSAILDEESGIFSGGGE